VLTIADYVTNNYKIPVTLTGINTSYNALAVDGNFLVDNAKGDMSSENFPGIKKIQITYGGSFSVKLEPGTYPLEINVENDGRAINFDDHLYFFYVAEHWNGVAFEIASFSKYPPFSATLKVKEGHSGLNCIVIPSLVRQSDNFTLEGPWLEVVAA